jgi:hypothetical protein
VVGAPLAKIAKMKQKQGFSPLLHHTLEDAKIVPQIGSKVNRF